MVIFTFSGVILTKLVFVSRFSPLSLWSKHNDWKIRGQQSRVSGRFGNRIVQSLKSEFEE